MLNTNKFILSTLKNSKLIVVLTAIITVFMGWQATRGRVDTDVNTLMPERSSRILQVQENLGVHNETPNYIFLSIHDDDLYNFEILQTFQNTIDSIIDIAEVEAAFTPFNFIFFDTKEGRIIPTTLSPTGRAPKNAEELAIFEERVKTSTLSENLVVADNGRILTALFNNVATEDTKRLMKEFNTAVAPLRQVTTVYHTGEVPFQERITYYLAKDFSVLLVLAFLAMLTIFFLSFRSLRAIILPVLVVVIGVIWTLGFMSLAQFPITVVTVIIPSLILTIGGSYTIHILNEYYRSDNSTDMEKNQWLANAVEHVIRTVIVAALTTIISFLSLLITTMRPLQEFGLSIGTGIFFCAILALFFLPAMFYLMGPPKEHQRKRIRRGYLSRLMDHLGAWASQHRFTVLGIFTLLIALFVFAYPRIHQQSDYFSYFPSDDPIIIGSRFINEHSGGSQTFNITLRPTNDEKNFFLDPDVLHKIDRLESALKENPCVTNTLSFNGILKSMNLALNDSNSVAKERGLILLLSRYFGMMTSERTAFGQDSSVINADATSLTIYLKLAEAGTYNMINESDMKAFLEFAKKQFKAILDDTMEVYLWGNTLLVLDSSRIIKRDQLRSTLISMLLGMGITWMFFQSFAHSLIALIPLLSGIFFYFITLFLTKIPLDMTTILVTNVTVGVGLDDAVHLLLQYRKQRDFQDYKRAISSSLQITGRPIVLTTLSLVLGLLVLCFGSFKPVVFFGFLIAGTLFSTMAGTIFFIPAAITFHERYLERKNRKQKHALDRTIVHS